MHKAPQEGFELETKGFQIYAIANLDMGRLEWSIQVEAEKEGRNS